MSHPRLPTHRERERERERERGREGERERERERDNSEVATVHASSTIQAVQRAPVQPEHWALNRPTPVPVSWRIRRVCGPFPPNLGAGCHTGRG